MSQHEMIEKQLKERKICDERVLEAMRKVPRHEFLEPENRAEAYEDRPVPIGLDQTLSQPYIVAFMTELLRLDSHDKVLEVGTGSGYQTAILAELSKEVYSVERIKSFYDRAKVKLNKMGYQNIHLRQGDGWLGWKEQAPFNKIIVTAAADHMPDALVDQLAEEGRIVIPLGPSNQNQQLLLGVKKNGSLETTKTIAVRFVTLHHGAASD